MQQKFRQAIAALREQTHAGITKLSNSRCGLDILILHSTWPNDLLVPESPIQDLLKTLTLNPSSARPFCLAFARRFSRASSWRVALKCLMLLHRLIRHPSAYMFSDEFSWCKSNGLLSLHPCTFRDLSASSPVASNHFTSFIRAYAKLLDHVLEFSGQTVENSKIISSRNDHSSVNLSGQKDQNPAEFSGQNDQNPSQNFSDQNDLKFTFQNNQNDQSTAYSTSQNEQRPTTEIVEILPRLQALLDMAMDCEPSSTTSGSFLVRAAMKLIVRDTFQWYSIVRRDLAAILDELCSMRYTLCVATLKAYRNVAEQSERLTAFYNMYQTLGLCGSYEYPTVEQIPAVQVRALESFLDGMWEITEDSSSLSSSPLRTPSSLPSGSSDDPNGIKFEKSLVTVVSTEWEEFVTDEKTPLLKEKEAILAIETEKPFIDFEEEHWEVLLESAVSQTPLSRFNDAVSPLGVDSYGSVAGLDHPVCPFYDYRNGFNQMYGYRYSGGECELPGHGHGYVSPQVCRYRDTGYPSMERVGEERKGCYNNPFYGQPDHSF